MQDETNQHATKRLKKSEVTRQKIIDQAYKLFIGHGFAETTASMISKAAGVSYGTVYTYFNSKSDIFIEIMEGKVRELYIMARTPFFPKTAQEAYGIICKQSMEYMSFGIRHKRIMEIIEEAMHLAPEIREKWENIRSYFLSTITQDIQYSKNCGLLKEGVIPEISARKWHAVNEAFLWEVVKDPERYNMEELSQILTREYVCGIYRVNCYEYLTDGFCQKTE